MTGRVVLRIRPGGTVEAVYSDAVAGLGLGPMAMTRATHVEFDASTQEWVATRVRDGVEIARGPSRAAVIDREVQLLQSELRGGSPT